MRVRLTPADREALETLMLKKGPQSTISTVIRAAVGSVTGPKGSTPVQLSPEAYAKLCQYADELGRSVETVADDCIFAVESCLRGERAPLIVEEIKLRRRYSEE